MTTSRTGTAIHRNMRAQTIHQAQANHQQTCPICGHWIDWDTHGKPNSPEADEIIPYYTTGQTSTNPNNWRIICRHCNQQLGAKHGNQQRWHTPNPLTTSQHW